MSQLTKPWLLVAPLWLLAGGLALADAKPGDSPFQLTPKAFIAAEADTVAAVHIDTTEAMRDREGACRYLIQATVTYRFRGNQLDAVEFCADTALNVGQTYLAFLYSEGRLTNRELEALDSSFRQRGEARPKLFLKPNWSYRTYSVSEASGRPQSYVVIPDLAVIATEACIARIERRVVEFSDDPLVHENKFNHLRWDCFIREATRP